MSVSLNLHLSLLPFLGVFSFCLFCPIPIYLFLFYFTILDFILLSPLICYLFPKERQKEGNSEQDRGGRNKEEQRERRRQSEYNVWKTAICNKRKKSLDHFIHLYKTFLLCLPYLSFASGNSSFPLPLQCLLLFTYLPGVCLYEKEIERKKER